MSGRRVRMLRPAAPPPAPAAVRVAYATHPGGAPGWYAEHGARYRNPHEMGVAAAILATRDWWTPIVGEHGRILDLACGSGEVTLALGEAGVAADRIDGADPYTGVAYAERVGRPPFGWTFAQLAAGHDEFLAAGPWALVVCSFALHLCEPSRLPGVCLSLAQRSDALLVLSPHKRPVLREAWGFRSQGESYDPRTRVRTRTYLRSRPL